MLLKPIAAYWQSIQLGLFPGIVAELSPATDKHLEIMVALDMIEIERFVRWQAPVPIRAGRPPIDRATLARAFVAKAILNLASTRALLDRLKVDVVLRRICGFERRVPSEATFSNVFAEFAAENLAERVHESMVRRFYQDKIVGHVCRDSTAITAREKCGLSHTKTEVKPERQHRKSGRRKRDAPQPPPRALKRLERHATMTVREMLDDLPKQCNKGGKEDARGNSTYWVGYKLHIDCGDGGVPLSCILASASLHDSQVAIALEAKTAERVTSLYSLMDSAYDCQTIRTYVESKGKVAIIAPHTQANGKKTPLCQARQQRYKVRTTIERVNGSLKDDLGGRQLRVRGHAKAFAHLMFGILALTGERLITVFS